MKRLLIIILLLPLVSKGQNEVYDLLEKGNAKYDLEDYSGSIRDFTSVIELDPMNTEAYNSRGLAKYFLDND